MARTIKIEVVTDTTKAERDAQKLGRSFKSALDPAVGSAGALRSSLTGLTSALGALASVAAFKQIAQFGIDLDRSRNAMTQLTGSVDAANKKLAQLRDLAKASPGVTQTFATQLFQQLKAIGGISDQVIDNVIKSLGKLNTVFGNIGPDFARNLIQIFQQGFERSDIKEALTRLPIFEQLLKSAFGTDDPEKLRKLKASGTLTMDTFLTGMSDSINKRLPNVTESLGGKLEKSLDETKQKLAELGEKILKDLLPALDKLIPALNKMLDIFSKLPDTAQAAAIGILLVAPAIGSVATALGGLRAAAVTLGGFLLTPGGIALLGLLGVGIAAFELKDLIENQIPRNVQQQVNPQGLIPGTGEGPAAFIPGASLTIGAGVPSLGLKLTPAGRIVRAPAGQATAAAKAAAAAGGGTGTRRRSGIEFLPLTAEDLVTSQFEGEAEMRAASAARARNREIRRGLTREFEQAEDAAFRADRLAQGRLSRAALTFDFEEREKIAKENEKRLKALEKTGELLSANERFARGFADAMITTGDAFERFGQNVADAFLNVKTLFDSLKRAVFDFFNDLLGSSLQNLVRQTLGPIFGGGGGAFGGGGISAPSSVSGGAIRSVSGAIGGGGGILSSIFPGGGGGGAAAGGGFSLSGLTGALGGAAPLLGVGLGSSLGGSSTLGKIAGGIGGGLIGTVAGVGLLGGSGPILALATNPFTLPIAAALLVGSVFLGKAAQRRKDEQASGQFLAQAISAIQQLQAGIAGGSIDGGQARGIFENQILGTFIQQINTLKTRSVRESRLTNQVADLRKIYEDIIPPTIAAQVNRRQTASSNALTHSSLIPEFATGGTTRGGLAFLHPGEKVLNLQQQAAVRAMAGSSVFERAGVPGVRERAIFEGGGTMGGGLPIVIDNLNVSLLVGKDDQTRIVVGGGSTARGRAVTVNNVKVARTNREL